MNADYAELSERLTPVAAAAFFERFPARRASARALDPRDPAQGAGGRALRAAGGDLRLPLPHGLGDHAASATGGCASIHDAPLEQRAVVDRDGRGGARGRPRLGARARGAAAARGDARARRVRRRSAARARRPAVPRRVRRRARRHGGAGWSTGSGRPRRPSPQAVREVLGAAAGELCRRRRAARWCSTRRATATSARRSTSAPCRSSSARSSTPTTPSARSSRTPPTARTSATA